MADEINAKTAVTSTSGKFYPAVKNLQTDVAEPVKNRPLDQSGLFIETSTQLTLQVSLTANKEWNSLTRISNNAPSLVDEKNETGKALKVIDNQNFSMAAVASSMMVMFLQIFSKLQKAQMDMSLAQLNLVLIHQSAQIAELKLEQRTQFSKDIAMACIEGASSLVQLIGSAVTVKQLGGNMTRQAQLGEEMKLAAPKTADAKIADAKTKTDQISATVESEALPVPIKTQAKQAVAETDSELANAKNVSNEIKQTVPARSLKSIQDENHLLSRQSELINARQQLLSGIAGFVKAASPAVQGGFGNQATEHQIKAKEAENAKEIDNALYRQYQSAADGMRDAIRGIMSLLQDMQSQDPNNSTASSKRLA